MTTTGFLSNNFSEEPQTWQFTTAKKDKNGNIIKSYDKDAYTKALNDYYQNQRYKNTQASNYDSKGNYTNSSGSTGIGGLSTSGNNSSSSSSSSLSTGDYLTSATDSAKSLAEFNLGLDKQRARYSRDLREEESQADFGRTTKLTDQTKGWERNINLDTQNAATERTKYEQDRLRDQQIKQIDQENFSTNRAINLASRNLGRRN